MNKQTELDVKKILNSLAELSEEASYEAHNAEVGLEVVRVMFSGNPEIQKILEDAQTICGLTVGRSRKLHGFRLNTCDGVKLYSNQVL